MNSSAHFERWHPSRHGGHDHDRNRHDHGHAVHHHGAHSTAFSREWRAGDWGD